MNRTTVRTVLHVLLLMVTLTGCAGVTLPADARPGSTTPAQAQPHAFVESGLEGSAVEYLSVIVTGENMDIAAAAVKAVGGTITSELWIINAVSATIPGDQLTALAATEGIQSVVADKEVSSSAAMGKIKNPPATLDQVVSDGQALAQADSWDLEYALSTDIGAADLHEQGVSGRRVTVAVVDSGVYFGWEASVYLNTKSNQFAGQADFVGEEVNCQDTWWSDCFSEADNSRRQLWTRFPHRRHHLECGQRRQHGRHRRDCTRCQYPQSTCAGR